MIGNGNVAADVARMLALTPDELGETDTADHAIEAFNGAAVKEILVLGRRGPAQAAFTNPEVRELGEMVDADIDIDAGEMELDELSREWLDSDDADPTNRRNVDIFTDFSQREPEGKPKRIVMRFLRSPIEIQGDGKVERIVVGRNELQRDDSRPDPRRRHRRARDDRVRPGPALDRLQGHPDRGRPLRRGPRPDPQRRWAASTTARASRSPASTRSAGSSAAPPA